VKLAPLDLLVLAAYLGGILALGVSTRARSAEQYILGGRAQPWWLILASIVATETSSVTFLSIPGFAFARDCTWLQLAAGLVVGRFAVAALLLPGYFQGRIVTAYQVLRQRFGGNTQRVAAALFLVTRSLADGLRLFLTAIVVQEVAGLPLGWAVVLLGCVTLAYTWVGGMQAVLWTDLVQLAVYLVAAAAALAVIVEALPGGLGQMLSVGAAAGHLRVIDPSLDLAEPHTLWAGLLGGAFLTLGSHGADQLMVQRYLCAPDLPSARRALLASGGLVFAQFGLFLLIGVGLFAFYGLHPPAVPFDRPDRVFARFIVEEMPAGLRGLAVGGVLAAAMSTLSSSLNSLATAAVNDLRRGAGGLGATRAFTVLFGAVQIGVGLLGPRLDGSVVSAVLAIAGFSTGIVLGLFLLGTLARHVSELV
jgi:SSS family transporter